MSKSNSKANRFTGTLFSRFTSKTIGFSEVVLSKFSSKAARCCWVYCSLSSRCPVGEFELGSVWWLTERVFRWSLVQQTGGFVHISTGVHPFPPPRARHSLHSNCLSVLPACRYVLAIACALSSLIFNKLSRSWTSLKINLHVCLMLTVVGRL